MFSGCNQEAEAEAVRPLTLDLIIPPEEFLAGQDEHLAKHMRYVDRYRKVRMGPRATLVFEDRQTLWFRVQQVIAMARLNDPKAQQRELDHHNMLLPSAGGLQAALLLDTPGAPGADLETWRGLTGQDIAMHLGPEKTLRANILSANPEDRCWGTAHWVQFLPEHTDLEPLTDPATGVWFSIRSGDYNEASHPISADIRQSLVKDLVPDDARTGWRL